MLLFLIKTHYFYKNFHKNILKFRALFTNSISFISYKNKYKNNEIVLLGAGPTLNEFKPMENVIYVGTNRTFKFEKVKLDYLFFQDNLIENDDQLN